MIRRHISDSSAFDRVFRPVFLSVRAEACSQGPEEIKVVANFCINRNNSNLVKRMMRMARYDYDYVINVVILLEIDKEQLEE